MISFTSKIDLAKIQLCPIIVSLTQSERCLMLLPFRCLLIWDSQIYNAMSTLGTSRNLLYTHHLACFFFEWCGNGVWHKCLLTLDTVMETFPGVFILCEATLRFVNGSKSSTNVLTSHLSLWLCTNVLLFQTHDMQGFYIVF